MQENWPWPRPRDEGHSDSMEQWTILKWHAALIKPQAILVFARFCRASLKRGNLEKSNQGPDYGESLTFNPAGGTETLTGKNEVAMFLPVQVRTQDLRVVSKILTVLAENLGMVPRSHMRAHKVPATPMPGYLMPSQTRKLHPCGAYACIQGNTQEHKTKMNNIYF